MLCSRTLRVTVVHLINSVDGEKIDLLGLLEAVIRNKGAATVDAQNMWKRVDLHYQQAGKSMHTLSATMSVASYKSLR